MLKVSYSPQVNMFIITCLLVALRTTLETVVHMHENSTSVKPMYGCYGPHFDPSSIRTSIGLPAVLG